MDSQIIKINKTSVNNEIGNKSIDRTFSELIPKFDLISVNQFFDYYNQLFYDIPRDGTTSHKTLINQSTEFYGNYIDPKDGIIRDLEKQILELNNQLLQGDLNDVELEEKIEKTIKVNLTLEGGSKLGKKKDRKKEKYKVTFTDFEGVKTIKQGSYNQYRKETFEFKGKPDFYLIDVFGRVDRRGSKKDWVHEYTSGVVNFSNNSPDIIIQDISIKNVKR
mgnify:CR=1 FL=1|tara:strand:- start:4827 stop:5486 length:660 start_codon:yes stop_codon:yes gene_type:complete